MDMKQILQALDKASSRKVEGANDMRRFVSIVQENNTLKTVADKISSAADAAKEKLSDFRPYDEKAVAKMYNVKTANNSNKKEDSDLEEAGKPGDPGFKPNLQVPQAPPFPEGDFSKPGSYDIGNGEKLTVNQDGTRVHAGASGTFTYDKAGKAIKYASPMFNGYSQEHDLVTGNITVKYMNGPLNVVKTYDKTGKETGASDAEYDLGVAKVRRQQDANKNVTNTASVPDGAATNVVQQQQPATEGKKSFLDYLTLAEEKQKGVDGKACWAGYKRMGTKQKGGKTVDNCVKDGK